jgi:hypothetical protein
MNTLRKELERLVYSTNIVLRDKVQEMGFVSLLRNVHPAFREDYARKLYWEKTISKDEANEFIKRI